MVFVVEKVIDRRTRKGEVEYYVKWKGRAHTKNTWEPEKSLDCKELIREFERNFKNEENPETSQGVNNQGASSSAPPSVAPARSVRVNITEAFEGNGFDRGLEALEIFGATEINGFLFFYIRFRGVEQLERVRSTAAYLAIPQMVLDFFERHLAWVPVDSE